MKKTYKKILAVILSVIALCLIAIPVQAENISASKMALARTEGTVAVLNGKNSVSLFKGMKLQSGYNVATSKASYAWINLDDTKLVKMDALSNVGVEQDGKNLILSLNTGKILVDVSKKLDADETLNIKTGNVITGVRGTLFTVSAEDPYFENMQKLKIVVLEGKVEATTVDLSTGRRVLLDIEQGNKGSIDINLANGKISSSTSKAASADVDGYSAVELALNERMRQRALTGSPDISLPNLANALNRLSLDINAQDAYINNLAALRNESIDKAIYYKVGIDMKWFGQTSDGKYISGMNPNSGEAQFVWNPVDSSGGVYRKEESTATSNGGGGGSTGTKESEADDGPTDSSVNDSGSDPAAARRSSSSTSRSVGD